MMKIKIKIKRKKNGNAILRKRRGIFVLKIDSVQC